VEELKRELDRVASLMDTDDESAMQELVQGRDRGDRCGASVEETSGGPSTCLDLKRLQWLF
jgi:hypothetical protein